jgi:hypothetical protein
MAVSPIAGDSEIEYRILLLDTGRGEKNIKHSTPLVGGYLNGERFRRGEIVLCVYFHYSP